ncbi:MAG: peptidylprolyl isomerase [Succinivibrio sp.]|nr:peptidylprolyl isomerase [Succinivibrio sp.]
MSRASVLKAALLGAALSACLEAAAKVEVLDSTAAVVNNDIILTSELNRAQARVQSNLRAQGHAVDELTARKAAMEGLITRSLLSQLAKLQGLDLTDTQLDQALRDLALHNHTTPEQILNSYGSHLSVAEQREAFKAEFLSNELQQSRIRGRINISESEVDSLARSLKTQGSIEPQYHLSQLIVPLSSNPTESEYLNAQATARSIRAQLAKGADFGDLAARYSRGADASQAGDLGYMPESRVPLPFVPALLKAHPGDVVGPIRSPMGLHFLKVHDISTDAVSPIKTYDAAHILIKPSIIFSDEAARAQLSSLRDDIMQGRTTFAKAARAYSQDPGSATQGGDLGYAPAERYDPAFSAMMVSLRPGQISEPVRSAFGWHIILLKDVKIDRDSDTAYRDKARTLIYQREYDEQQQLWEKELRESSYVHIIDPALLNAGVMTNNPQQDL